MSANGPECRLCRSEDKSPADQYRPRSGQHDESVTSVGPMRAPRHGRARVRRCEASDGCPRLMRSAWPRSRNTHQDGHFASRAAPDGKGELNADSGVVVLCNQDPSHRGSTSGCPHPRVPRGPGWGGLRAPVGRTEGPRPLPRGRGPSSRSRRVNPPCFTRFVGLGRGWHDGVAAHRSSAWPPPILGKSLTPSSGDESPAAWRLPSRREGGWRVVPVPRTGPVPHPPRRRSQGPPKASAHVAEGRGRRVRHRRCSRSRKPTPDTKIAKNASSVYPRSNMRGTVLQRRFRTGPCPSRRAGSLRIRRSGAAGPADQPRGSTSPSCPRCSVTRPSA